MRPDSKAVLAGFIAGVLPVAGLPTLPPAGVALAVLVVSVLVVSVLAVGVHVLVPAQRLPVPYALAPGRVNGYLTACLPGLLAGFSLAVLAGHALLERRLAPDCVREPVQLEGEVASLPVTSHIARDVRRQRFEFRPRNVHPGRCAGPARVLLSYYGPKTVRPGEAWRFQARLKRPWGLANPGSHNMQAWFAQTGVDAVGSASAGARLASAGPLDASHQRWRWRIAGAIERQALDADVSAVLRALAVADKSGVDGRLWSLFQRFGLNHLLVVSGLHVGLVAGLGFLLGGVVARLFGPRALYLPACLALLLAAAYAALAGFSLPTQRALCMLAAPLVALALGRRSAATHGLLLAAVVVLALNPLAGLGSGFWLSFGAVAALLWIGCWRREQGLVRGFVRAHLCMSLLMVPLGAWFFGGASLVSALANMVMIPVVGLFVVPAVLAGAACFMIGLPAYTALWKFAAWPLEVLLPVGRALADERGTWLYRHVAADWVTTLLALVAVALLVTPVPVRLRLAALVLLAPLLFVGPREPDEAAGVLHATVLDVGQGTSVVLRSGGRTLVYDTGGGDPRGSNIATGVLLPYLAQLGVSELDTLVVSHGDLDHAAGLGAIVERFPIRRLRTGESRTGAAVAPGTGRRCRAGEAWRWPGGIRFQVLSPAAGEHLDSNDQSCVLRVSVGDFALLLPGDVEGARERGLARYWAEALDSDWLLVGHHGSRTSSTWPFLKRVRPREAVVSSGYANRFGHPHPTIVSRLENAGARVHNTAAAGALEFTIGPGGVRRVGSYREKYHRYWM